MDLAEVAELADARDSKSRPVHPGCGFEPHLRQLFVLRISCLRFAQVQGCVLRKPWWLLVQPDSLLLQPGLQIAHFSIENLVVVVLFQLVNVGRQLRLFRNCVV
jgi:hypothetical protein